MPSDEAPAKSIASDDFVYSGGSGSKPHWITQKDLNGRVCNLYLSMQQSVHTG